MIIDTPRLISANPPVCKVADRPPKKINNIIAYIKPKIAPIDDDISVKGTNSMDFISLISTIFSPRLNYYYIIFLTVYIKFFVYYRKSIDFGDKNEIRKVEVDDLILLSLVKPILSLKLVKILVNSTKKSYLKNIWNKKKFKLLGNDFDQI